MRLRRAEARDVAALHALILDLNRDQGDPTDLLTPQQLEADLVATGSAIVTRPGMRSMASMWATCTSRRPIVGRASRAPCSPPSPAPAMPAAHAISG